MAVLSTSRKKLTVQVALALLPVSICAADVEIADGEKVSAILADSRPGTSSAPTIIFSNDNILVNGSVNIDSSNITPEQAGYIVHAYGRTIDLGQGSHVLSENSANLLTAEASGLIHGTDISINATDNNYGQTMGQMYGINAISSPESAENKLIDLAGVTRVTLNNFSGNATGISANCGTTADCNNSQSINIQLEDLGVNVIAAGEAKGVEAIGQNIAVGDASVVVNSNSKDVNVQGLVAAGGSITATGYTDLSVSGNGALTAISASGPSASGLANIDLQGGASLTLVRDQNNTHGINGVVAADGANVRLSDSWLTLYSDASVSETDRFVTAKNSRDDVASTIVVDGQLNVAVSEDSPLSDSLIYVGAEGNSSINLNGSTTLGDLRNADNATAFYARDGSQIALNDQQVKAWGAVTADNGSIDLRTADNSYLYSTLSTLNGGTTNLALNGASSVWDMTGSSSLTNLQLNGGTINFLNDSGTAFKTLTVNGDYSGNGGTLVMNVTLNSDDDSPSERMLVTGNTSGSTTVKFNHIYGHGDHTDMGIELITVGGASDGQFTQDRRLGIGLYDYALVQKGKNWYLSNSLADVEGDGAASAPAADNPDAGNNSDPNGSGGSGSTGGSNGSGESGNTGGSNGSGNSDTPNEAGNAGESGDSGNADNSNGSGSNTDNSGRYDYTKVYRPESGSYIANITAANTLFLTRLHDRQGEHEYVDYVTGERHSTTLWMRNTGSHSRFEEAGGQLISRSNSYVLQLGGDVAHWSSNARDGGRLGVMAGYGHNHNKSRSQVTGYTSRGQVNGYSVGLYGTWFADEATRTGAWVDSWVQYSWFHNEVSGHQMREEKYHADGVTASLEAGYALPIGTTEKFSYWLEPRGQAVWMNVQADSLVEDQGTHVSSSGSGNVMTQLGMRAWMKGKPEKGMADSFRPYVEANWIHHTRAFGVRMNGENNTMIGSRNLAEARIGAEGEINSRLALWADVGQRIGQHKYSDTRGTLGVKFQF
ncbi:autotransporter outer membrane beta-barrel domain-containing protein [Mixta sp. Marseille-Q2659]|uniref:autotransporter outer membrane beta-barrel domain-containing protein n=1 Tax=Mixta sp. Marseille-Q2659 TaxID=2736607 RepID=UPI0023B9DA6E|nr:autotransporter outer membrane beta-barrel domain-containing protein [Mixta sp. Marseille-Q2659]